MHKKKWLATPRWFLSPMLLVILILSMMPICLGTNVVLAESAPALLWEKTFGGPAGFSYGYCVEQTADGGYLVGGSTYSFGAGSLDIWLIKTDGSGNKQWDKTFGGSQYDGVECGRCVEPTADGGCVIAGFTYSYGAGSKDVWLIKTDGSGNKQWDRTFGGAELDGAWSVQQTADGGYVVAGYTWSLSSGDDVWLIKTDAFGNKQWDQTFGGAESDIATSVRQTSDGGYVVAGCTESYGAGGADFWVVKTDASGGKQWDRTFGGAESDDAFSVQQTADGGYAVAGCTWSYGAGDWDFWLIKTNASGNKQWDSTFGGSAQDWAYSMQQTVDGGYVVGGSTESYGTGGADFWLVKTDASGNRQWNQTFGNTGGNRAFSVQQTVDGGYVMVGETGSQDIWLIKTTSGLMEGDVSGNSHVSISDALMIARYKAGMITLTASQLLSADTNDDGNVTMADAMHTAEWLVDPDGSLGVLRKPLWESPADDAMLPPQP